jgi:hypothetical protein
VAFTVVAACSTPAVETAVGQSPGDAAGPMKRVVVFAGRVQEADRRSLEDAYVIALSQYGVRATPSYALFPLGHVPDDQEAVRTFLQQGGYDGALVTTLTDVSAPVLVGPGMDWAGGFEHSYFGSRAPGEADTEPLVTFETTLWNPTNGKMVWSTFTDTNNPRSGPDFLSSLISKVLPPLAREGLTPPGPGAPVSHVLPVSATAHDARSTRSVQ